MADGKTVVVDLTCKDAEDFAAQQATIGLKGTPIKEVRILPGRDGIFWVQAVEGKSGQDLCFFSLTVRNAYVGVLVALWLWHYGAAAAHWNSWSWEGRTQVWGSRLMRWVAVVSRWVLLARRLPSPDRSRPAES